MSILPSTYPPDSKTFPYHRRRNNSGELDVFEATRYFSGFSDVVLVSADPKVQADVVMNPTVGYSASGTDKDQDRQQRQRTARRSLDVPMTRAHVTPNGTLARSGRSQALSKEKSPRTPSSPGGKIVSFLNSLFSQSASSERGKKKKVKKTSASRSLKDQDQISPGGWQRRRRSSTSHIPTPSVVAESKSLLGKSRAAPSFFDANSDSRMIRACTIVDAPRSDTRNLSDHRQAAISVSIGNRAREEFAKWKVSCVEKEGKDLRTMAVAADPCEDEDDCNDSDMSSDLFELPVYDSTRIDSIRRSSMSTDSSGSSCLKLHV
ncbi:hypothetical protein MLD38_011479 [Melastoma candidum]|uniref:Uncharacterized protein n=1 Tax=Melastoma candidum TaxID=119954 RepID=A0ACB9R4Y8_9MYRT|nr:hypothetical protein MLD38_011479 [Melastoma candidum]